MTVENSIMPADTMQVKLKEIVSSTLRDSVEVKLELIAHHIPMIVQIAGRLSDCMEDGGKVLLFGNGGSAADAQHLAAELIGRFQRERRALPALALTTDTSILTAIANDKGQEYIFSRQIEALAAPKDAVIAISTSGKSPNILNGLKAARAKGSFLVGLTGKDGAALAEMCDLCLMVPSRVTARIQEAHITVGHILCDLVESRFAD
ncbi:MAG: D-sedoheptulose 7-phosphate isomerase [Syntrophobacteraceae bacterium]